MNDTLAVRADWKPDLKTAGVLALAAGLAVLALFPYLLQTMPGVFARVPVPLPVVAAAQALQGGLLIGLLALLGLRMGHRCGLGAPVLQAWLGGAQPPPRAQLRPLQSLLIGAAFGALAVALSALIDPLLPPMRHPLADVAAGQSALNGLLASFYGGIAEEIQLRLFLMTLLVWIVALISRRRPAPQVYWAALAVAALLFGTLHLPAAQAVWGLTPLVMIRTVALNAVAGLAFGWLYWKRGIEMAMLGHFAADLVLHVAAPLLVPQVL